MIEKLIDELVENYTKNVVSSFKIVAGKAYKDGIKAGLKLTRQLLDMENTEFDYGHNVTRRDDE